MSLTELLAVLIPILVAVAGGYAYLIKSYQTQGKAKDKRIKELEKKNEDLTERLIKAVVLKSHGKK